MKSTRVWKKTKKFQHTTLVYKKKFTKAKKKFGNLKKVIKLFKYCNVEIAKIKYAVDMIISVTFQSCTVFPKKYFFVEKRLYN